MPEKEKTILIVEDEKALAKALGDRFVEQGVNVLKAANGKEGLSMALSEHPDLILLDVIMPEMGGLEMLKELRKDEWGKKAQVVILTVLNKKEAVSEALEGGALNFFVKADWKVGDLVERVKGILEK